MIKIAIAGLGGVGGFFGGQLARRYQDRSEAEIYFFARGEHLEVIRKQGLTVKTEEDVFTARPFFASDNPNDFGRLDLILFCCKSYSLEEVAKHFSTCIHPGTLLLPLLNGVDSGHILQRFFPQNDCLFGCTYLVSRKTKAGEIEQKGKIKSIYFGHEAVPFGLLQAVEQVLQSAGIQAVLVADIKTKIWEKFCFIAPVSTLTSATGKTIGEILLDEILRKTLKDLIGEVSTLAQTKGIHLPTGMTDSVLQIAESLPPETKSSMQVDFAAGKQTELEAIAGYIVKESKTPPANFQQFYLQLNRVAQS
jgi:2-dehydropantoate 2-reductase